MQSELSIWVPEISESLQFFKDDLSESFQSYRMSIHLSLEYPWYCYHDCNSSFCNLNHRDHFTEMEEPDKKDSFFRTDGYY